MSGNRDILVLEFIRRLGAKVDALTADLRDLRQRVTRLEHRIAAQEANEALHHAATLVSLDRLNARLDRIEYHSEAPDRPVPDHPGTE